MLYPQFIDLKCISHASCNVGLKLFDSCTIAVKFIGIFNNMMNTSSRARSVFRELIHSEVKRYTSDIRWFYRQEVSSQVLKYWEEVVTLINHEETFAAAVRNKLKTLVQGNEADILLELSLLEDAGIPLAKLCYYQEGDGFLIPTTFDHWNEVKNLLQDFVEGRKLLPRVTTTSLELFPNDIDLREEKYYETSSKILSCLQKMNDSTNLSDKHLSTLTTFRACRILDYRFIAKTPYESIVHTLPNNQVQGEIVQLLHLPFILNDIHLQPFVVEMQSYHEISRATVQSQTGEEDDDPAKNILCFWKRNVLTLPNFAELARKIACLSPSSATVERLFSLLSSFNDNQGSALADYAKARCMIRYNHIFRERYS